MNDGTADGIMAPFTLGVSAAILGQTSRRPTGRSHISLSLGRIDMGRSGVITFKGNPMTLEGQDLAVGAAAPAFALHYFDAGMKTLTLDDLKGKPSIISVVP